MDHVPVLSPIGLNIAERSAKQVSITRHLEVKKRNLAILYISVDPPDAIACSGLTFRGRLDHRDVRPVVGRGAHVHIVKYGSHQESGKAADMGFYVCVGGEDSSRADIDFVRRVAEAGQDSGALRFRFAVVFALFGFGKASAAKRGLPLS